VTVLSILDLAPIVEGGDAATALRNSLDLARHAEGWGYRRIWLAEHHNMPGVASAATSIVIGHVAAGTSHIRVGAGGIMLPNHAPLVIAEQFGTLDEALSCSFVGSAERVRRGLAEFVSRTGADELIITAHVHDHGARLRSFEIAASCASAAPTT
jgi:alkanesulfonate monooxygenase SsuD/methylene tetrahydromethanopterin reductase-like flavin-dependent oxidoreductase (luciferase family)